MKNKKIINIILAVFLTLIICSAIGYLFYGMMVFDPSSSTFGLISYGAVGAIAFAAFYRMKMLIAVIVVILLLIAIALLNFESFAKSALTASLYFVSTILSAYVHSEFIFKKMTIDKFIRPLLLSVLFTVMFGVSAIITILTSAQLSKFLLFVPVAGLGTIIGLCVGVSIEFADSLTNRIVKE